MRANARLMMRRLHHRTTDHSRRYLLGHARGRAADLLSLLTVILHETEGSADCLPGETWGLEWWQQVEVYLPIQMGSLAAAGRGLLPRDPDPMLFMRPLPDESPEPEEADEEVNHGQGHRLPRDDPRPDLRDEDVEFLAEAEREARDDRVLQDREAAWAERSYVEELRREEELLEQHKARVAQDYEDWALWDEMHQQPPRSAQRKRPVAYVEMASGSDEVPRVAKILKVPLESEREVQLMIKVQIREETPEENIPTALGIPGRQGPMIEPSQGTGLVPSGIAVPWDPQTVQADMTGEDAHPAAEENKGVTDTVRHPEDMVDEAGLPRDLSMEFYFAMFDEWRHGRVADSEIVTRYGIGVLELMQTQRMLINDDDDTQQLLNPRNTIDGSNHDGDAEGEKG